MRYLSVVSLLPSADGDQQCHFKERGAGSFFNEIYT